VYQVQELTERHQQIIRLRFAGLLEIDIAGRLGVARETVVAVLNSPLAKTELARLGVRAEEILTNVPLQLELQADLRSAGREALHINRTIMKDDEADKRVRASIGRHFLDRIVFEMEPEEEREGSYRQILRGLSEIQRSLGRDVLILPPVNEGSGNGGGDSSGAGVGGAAPAQE